jgi:hypothetical protein
MWQEASSFLKVHPKFLGITGDSLTFLGSILLILEALFKKVQFVSVDQDKVIVKYFPYAEDAGGRRLSPRMTEENWMMLWLVVSRVGAFFLVGGFGFLLLSRIFSE